MKYCCLWIFLHCSALVCCSNLNCGEVSERFVQWEGEDEDDGVLPMFIKLDIPVKDGESMILFLMKDVVNVKDVKVYLGTETGQKTWRRDDKEHFNVYVNSSMDASFSVVTKGEEVTYFGVFVYRNEGYTLTPAKQVGKMKSQDVCVTFNETLHVISRDELPKHIAGRGQDYIELPERLRAKRSSSRFVTSARNNKRVGNELVYLTLKVFVVVDYSLYRKWLGFEDNDHEKTIETIRYHYSHVLNGIRNKYQTIDTFKYRYDVRLIGMFIAETRNDSFTESLRKKGNEEAVDYSQALEELRKWTKSKELRNYSVVTAFTALKDLSDAAGLAYTKTACTHSGVSIVADRGQLATINSAAHEIGHNLGAYHDGEGNDCKESDNFLMAPKPCSIEELNFNIFSPCSRKYFEEYIDSLESHVSSRCFVDEIAYPEDDRSKKFLSILPGQKYTPDHQCQHSLGHGSRYCSAGAKAHLKICREMSCYDPGRDVCIRTMDSRALDGTPCGNGKWCKDRQCAPDPRAPAVDNENCMYGDVVGSLLVNNVSTKCSDLMKDPGQCYHEFFTDVCCKTCDELSDPEASEDCKFGDKSTILRYGEETVTCNDFKEFPGYCYIENFKTACCKTCKELEVKTDEHCPFGDGFMHFQYDGQTLKCSDFAHQHKHLCYHGDVRKTCCHTCEAVRNKSDHNCEFGDKVSNCKALFFQHGSRICRRQNIREDCCETCSLGQ